MNELEVIIGLEVHAQMSTKTKMFCGCDNDAFGKAPNTTVCPVCMGHPGTLPVPNKEAVQKAVRTSLAIKGKINSENHFDRKHYFYPDLPAGFQISQYDFPLSSGGQITYLMRDGSGKVIKEGKCGITRIHMENDAGKLTHRGNTTLCDYNRAGTPLMEIVTEPDLRSADEAVAFTKELRRILIAVNASDADMFKGMMRFDASISLREKGTEKLNPRSEIKNLNSFKSLEKALKYEEKRLRKEWGKNNGPLKNDITVGWLDNEEKTKMLRNKETADDYRYFPEPDIPPIKFTKEDIENIRKELPAMPNEKKQNYINMGLDESIAIQLIDEPRLQMLFDAIVKVCGTQTATAIVIVQLQGFLKKYNKTLDEAPNEKAMTELVEKIENGKISSNTGKNVLEKMIASGKSAETIISEEGMQQISDTSKIEDLVQKALDANPNAVQAFKNGKDNALGAIVGWIMKESKGQADPAIVNMILREKMK